MGETEASATGSIPVSPALGLQQAPGRRRGHKSPPLAGRCRRCTHWRYESNRWPPGWLSQRPDPHQFSKRFPRRFPGDFPGAIPRCRPSMPYPLRSRASAGVPVPTVFRFSILSRFRRFSAPRAPRRPNGPAPAVGLVGRLDSSKSGSLPPAPRPFHGYELLPCLPMSLTRQTPSWMGLRTASSFSTGSIPCCSGPRPSLHDAFRLTQR